MAKLTEKERLSIVANYMGTPEAMYSSEGQKVWSCELNSYGKVRNFQGEYVTDCPFRYQGQYHDSETGLYYNRFRYYSPDEGVYISQDPIRLNGGIRIYSYVSDTNGWVDVLGLDETTVPEGGLISVGSGGGYTIARGRKDFGLPKDAPGSTKLPAQTSDVQGRSTYDTVEHTSHLGGGKYQIEGGTELPQGLAVVADDRAHGGVHGEGHHTIYNTEEMTLDEFVNKQNEIESSMCS